MREMNESLVGKKYYWLTMTSLKLAQSQQLIADRTIVNLGQTDRLYY